MTLNPEANDDTASGLVGEFWPPRAAERKFAVGDRVIVVDNAYDERPIGFPDGTHTMRGCFGKVTEISDSAIHPGRQLLTVRFIGSTNDPFYATYGPSGDVPDWLFYPNELAHAD